MNLFFKPFMVPKWSIDNDRIICGESVYLLDDIVKLSPLTLPKSRMANGVIQVWFSNGKFKTLAFGFNEKEEGVAVYEYIKSRTLGEKKNIGEIEAQLNKEYRILCNVCGKVTCYNQKDIDLNNQLIQSAKLSSVTSVVNALGGTMYNSYESNKMAQHSIDRIKDFSRCPSCNSTDIKTLTDEEWIAMKKNNDSVSTAVSSADELKKFKELLDSGIITQEEFDAKKKQLLGL